MAANIDDNASTSLSSGTNQNRLTIDMSDNRKTGFSNLTGYSTNKDESTTSQIHIPPISTVPSTTHSVIKPVINRPTTMKTSPTTEYLMSPASYQRHVSFPNGTTTATVADGRSVVPWNLGTRDLSQEVADLPRTSETNTNNQETVTLSTSVFSDGTPQWIPPGQKSSRHRLLSCPPSKLVEFAAQDNTNSASVSVRNQITKGDQAQTSEHPAMVNGNNLLQRQISAGPTFNFSPTKTKLSPSTGVFSEESSSLLIDAERNRSFQPDNYRTVAAKSSPRNCVSEQVAAQLREGNRTSLVYKIHGSGLPDTSARYVADPRMAHGDALPSMHLMQRVPFDEPQTPEGVDCESLPSMTQSVFFPPSAAWAQSTHHSFIDKSQCSSSGRRRRSKHGVSRSHSHRTVDQLKSKQLSRESDADQLGYGFPMAYYQRSISHTVPSDVTAATDEWPPVLAQWHHRRPVVYSTESFDPVVRSQWQIRKEKRSKSGRSTHDLVNVDVGRQMQPHHHSASAIFERLDIQPWFHFDLSRAKAEKILKSTPVGSFLVRQSETSKSEYSLSIRHYTTSEMEMLRALNHQLSPGRTESATDQTPTEYLSGRSPFKTSVPIHDNAPITLLEYQPLSPAEAEWWRAQQRSKMIALSKFILGPFSFSGQRRLTDVLLGV
ncbi:hypothetical protein AHF37_09915 [Paragonimus kellicotti]|nr:hypothetical protein AHF37_09915 [Paragonimus kellicotti]